MAHKHDSCNYNKGTQPCTSGVVEIGPVEECTYSACEGQPHCHCACKCHSGKTCPDPCGFVWPKMDQEWPWPKPWNPWRDEEY